MASLSEPSAPPALPAPPRLPRPTPSGPEPDAPSGNMQAAAQQQQQQLRAGSRVSVTIDHVVNDTLVVTLLCPERSYTGILLDCRKK